MLNTEKSTSTIVKIKVHKKKMFLGLSALNMIFVLVLENTANQITVSSISSALIGRFWHTEFETRTKKFDNRKTISLAVLIQMYSIIFLNYQYIHVTINKC